MLQLTRRSSSKLKSQTANRLCTRAARETPVRARASGLRQGAQAKAAFCDTANSCRGRNCGCVWIFRSEHEHNQSVQPKGASASLRLWVDAVSQGSLSGASFLAGLLFILSLLCLGLHLSPLVAPSVPRASALCLIFLFPFFFKSFFFLLFVVFKDFFRLLIFFKDCFVRTESLAKKSLAFHWNYNHSRWVHALRFQFLCLFCFLGSRVLNTTKQPVKNAKLHATEP